MTAENSRAGRVKCGHPHLADFGSVQVAQQFRHSLFHLVGGFVGEGDGKNPIVRHPPLADEMGDPAGNHTGLARPSPRHHEQRPFAVRHSFKLARVEVGEQVRHRASGALGCEAGDKAFFQCNAEVLHGWEFGCAARNSQGEAW